MLHVTSENKSGKELEAEVEEEIAAFDEWFQKGGQVQGGANDPLSKPETAILKTFCWWLVQERARQAREASTLPAPPPSTAEGHPV